MTLFLFLLIGYVILCIVGVRGYFYLQKRNIEKVGSGFRQIIYSYLLFAIFICLEIPFAIFFPMWLNEKLTVVDRTSQTTMCFLLLGCLTLALATWKGRASKPEGF